MRIAVAVITLFAALLTCAPASATPALNATTSTVINDLIATRAAAGPVAKGELIERLSGRLLGTPYRANMLIGSASEPEQLVIDLSAVDCFTFLDYVNAATTATNPDTFTTALIATRYRDSRVEFASRKHFFTDWATGTAPLADDITATLSADATTVAKTLNAKGDGSLYLPGLPTVDRAITYLPSSAVDAAVTGGLRTGDYLGAYTPTAGLDVTHVGILINTPAGPMFRNASSLVANNRVVDQPLSDYLATVPGVVVLRPR
ncbi:N-acetylmuramoyl-L-alanine amidase-like domain-containing protein [Nocardia camponoti]|uniref:DUF1460 domain-containing protein n=1 Tax=Nocardia camponoti TaxID=1616106 RepID=A0A917Q994_9NOCA|nr:N-acetylmuramoyl-L-alanine amidase-like domain-containing protein [Nocardia camponoti]GGK36531.1 hypothetical protein GCM10011591_05200 [Nocardia camponoti]